METVLLTCGYCGARIQLSDESPDTRVCTCQYCRSTVLIPEDRTCIESWYNRAEFHRRNCDFDKAIETYEQILKENDQDPVAHWGMALSKYGIEYVDDPVTRELVPTCHRTREQTILSDPEYLAAIGNADAESRVVMQKEASRIHDIQKKIIDISRLEKPYDVFISCKETTASGDRSADSVLAQDIYNLLSDKGYTVFFARKSLEGKIGAEFEPVIYAALKNAKIMIVVGTRPEHFNSVWVRNEWRRFQIMSKDDEKLIIPAYRDMSPYELPVELAAIRSLDMSKIGFLQELEDGIERFLKIGKSTGERTVVGTSNVKSADWLNENGETFLLLEDVESATETFETMTKDYPADYRGWWGRILCESRDLSRASGELALLDKWFGHVKTLIGSKQPDIMAGLQQEYLAIQSDIANYMAGDKKKYFEQVSSLERTESALELEIQALRRSIEQKRKQVNESRLSCEKSIKEIRYSLIKKQREIEATFSFSAPRGVRQRVLNNAESEAERKIREKETEQKGLETDTNKYITESYDRVRELETKAEVVKRAAVAARQLGEITTDRYAAYLVSKRKNDLQIDSSTDVEIEGLIKDVNSGMRIADQVK